MQYMAAERIVRTISLAKLLVDFQRDVENWS
jgi:hypothetical protein